MDALDSFRGSSLPVVKIGIIAIAGIIVIWAMFQCVVDVPANQVGILLKKTGEPLPPGVIVAPDDSYAGIQQSVLKTGWHMINPFTSDVEIVKAVVIPQERFGLVNRKSGSAPKNPSDILVEKGERGYQKALLEPGTHFLNPHIFEVTITKPIRIPALHVGIITSLTGKPTTKDLVDPGERGLRKDVLGPGVHILNPKGYNVEVEPAIDVSPGKVGIVRSKFGTMTNDDLVKEGQQGIWRKVLRPGTYNWNTKALEVEIRSAVNIEAGYVGVAVAQTDQAIIPTGIAVDPKIKPGKESKVAALGMRGIQPYTLPPGLHYLNPYEYRVVTFDARRHKYEMTLSNAGLSSGEVQGDDRLAFPSSDGFEIKVDTSIEWQIKREHIPEVVADIGGINDVIKKIIRPNAREIGRLEGSKLEAKDFILGDKREQFVRAFEAALKQRCAIKKVEIHNALVRAVFPPEAVAKPLKEKEVSLLRNEANVQKQVEAKSKADLAEEESKIQQKREVIKADTSKLVAELNAEREKEVARIQAVQRKEVANVEQQQQALILERQKLEAKGIRELADAEAHRAKSLIRADGALDKKLKAWSMVMAAWAKNANLVPKVVVGGGGSGGKGLTGQELIMTLMSIERLDRFIASGKLEMSPENE